MTKRSYPPRHEWMASPNIRKSFRDVLSLGEALEELDVARCPVCRMILIARMRRGRPGFYCRCVTRDLRRAG